jgi:hypothetical protein
MNVFSGMGCRVGLVTVDGSEEIFASIFRMKRLRKLGTTLAVTSNTFLRNVGFSQKSRGVSPQKTEFLLY